MARVFASVIQSSSGQFAYPWGEGFDFGKEEKRRKERKKKRGKGKGRKGGKELRIG